MPTLFGKGGILRVENTLLKVKNVKKHFPLKKPSLFSRQKQFLKAVDGVNITVKEGETLGIVGESGCGKSTLGRVILNLLEPTEGEVHFKGENIQSYKGKKLQMFRKDIQLIFQDPYASLNPRRNIKSIIMEPMKIFKIPKQEREERLARLLETVGIIPSAKYKYPHEFSGGQRQRIGIARALALEPKIIVCDEPVSALDVSIQAQIINLLEDLQDKLGLTYIFIAHDLSVINHISDRVAVMYLGEIVEEGNVDDIYSSPKHPYTQALLSSIPEPSLKNKTKKIILKGDLPSPSRPPQGCKFHTRCPYAKNICKIKKPLLKNVSLKGQKTACHFVEEV